MGDDHLLLPSDIGGRFPQKEECYGQSRQGQHGHREEYGDVASHDVPQVPGQEASDDRSHAVGGEDRTVIRTVVLRPEEGRGAGRGDRQPTPQAEPEYRESQDVDRDRTGCRSDRQEDGCSEYQRKADHGRVSGCDPVYQGAEDGSPDPVEDGEDSNEYGRGSTVELEDLLANRTADAYGHESGQGTEDIAEPQSPEAPCTEHLGAGHIGRSGGCIGTLAPPRGFPPLRGKSER